MLFGGCEWTQTPSWSARGLRVWSRRPNSPTPAGASSFSIRSRRLRSAVRRSGRSADCSSSTRPSSAACASATAAILRCRTGSARRASIARRITGRAAGPRPMWISPPARSAPGCAQQGLRIFPIVGWAERGGYLATGHGNSVPRFHVTWGTGPGVIEPFVRRVREAESRGLVSFRFRHRVTALTKTGGAVDGVQGDVLEAEQCRTRHAQARAGSPARSRCARRRSSSRRAASAAITSWCGAIGRSASASRRAT